jgi:hypothetical protein
MRVYRITVRNAPAGIVIGAIALVVGGSLLALGATLLAGVALGGTALRAGALAIRRLTGRPTVRPLDPQLEVFPPPPPGSAGSPDSPASRDGATALLVSRDAPGDHDSTG